MNLSELTNGELDRIAAVEVMGWIKTGMIDPAGDVLPTPRIDYYCTTEEEGDMYVCDMENWHPCTDRNQSRIVVEAAVAKASDAEVACCLDDVLGNSSLGLVCNPYLASPRQEVEASILAVRAIKGENDDQL